MGNFFVFLLNNLVIFAMLQFCRLVGNTQSLYHFGNIAVHKVFQVVQGKVYSVVGYTALWKVVGTDTFTSVARADLSFTSVGVFLIGLCLIQVVQLALKHFHSVLTVLYLTALCLTSNHYTRWNMRYSYCAFRLVDVLSTCATTTIGIYL